MEENNLNSNNQMNTNNNMEQQIQPSKGNNKMLIVLMVLIIVGLVGYFVYTKFIQKPDPITPKDNNTQEKDDNVLDNNTDEIVFEGENQSFVLKGDTIYTYDSNKKLISEKKYDKVIRGSDETRGYIALVYDNNSYYLIDKAGKMIKLTKDNTYSISDKEVEIYKKDNDSYFAVIDKEYYLIDLELEKNEESNNNYGDLCLDPDKMMCSGYLLVDVNKSEIINHVIWGYFTIYTVNNGSYFVKTKLGDSIADVPYSLTYADEIVTDKGVVVNVSGIYTVTNNKVIGTNEDGLIAYDINGKEAKSLKCDKVYGIGDSYSLIKINDKYYIVDLKNDFTKKEIQIDNAIKIKYIYEMDDKEMIFSTGEGDTYEEFYKKYSFTTGKLESAILEDN